ncbi:MAG: SDR family oxidoreductase [Terrimonas sp.]|nr:SDR family oxidoreductase [Terrimonas sp.]
MDLSLQHKTALICGSTRGIGLAIAVELASLGANCILLARDEQTLQQVIKELDTRQAQQHHYFVADFSDTNAVRKTIAAIARLHTIHILINNTGGPKPGAIIAADPSAFETAFQQHVINNQVLTQALVPGMKQSGYGRIINIISTSVRIPIDNLGVSNTIRAAVAAWAKTMSNELGQFNITVNNILPGYTETGRLKSLIATNALNRKISEKELAREMEDSIPMKRFGQVAEIASVAAFLASPAASYVNGVSIPVDGGKTGTL